jgi:hypothetical protein
VQLLLKLLLLILLLDLPLVQLVLMGTKVQYYCYLTGRASALPPLTFDWSGLAERLVWKFQERAAIAGMKLLLYTPKYKRSMWRELTKWSVCLRCNSRNEASMIYSEERINKVVGLLAVLCGEN